MFSKIKLLEARVDELEHQVNSLKQEREMIWDVVNAKYKNVEAIIDRYVRQHIWFETQENLQAFEKGQKLRVVLKDFFEVMGDYKPTEPAPISEPTITSENPVPQ